MAPSPHSAPAAWPFSEPRIRVWICRARRLKKIALARELRASPLLRPTWTLRPSNKGPREMSLNLCSLQDDKAAQSRVHPHPTDSQRVSRSPLTSPAYIVEVDLYRPARRSTSFGSHPVLLPSDDHSRMTLPCTAPTLSKLRRWSYERQAMPPMTKGQSGQVHDDRSLSVPQLSASATADGFECYWDSDRFKDETSHCR